MGFLASWLVTSSILAVIAGAFWGVARAEFGSGKAETKLFAIAFLLAWIWPIALPLAFVVILVYIVFDALGRDPKITWKNLTQRRKK